MSDIKWKQEEFELLWKDKESWKQEDGTYICPICGKKFMGIKNHIKFKHFGLITYGVKLIGKPSWNKGLTKESDIRVKKISNTLKDKIKSGEIKRWNISRSNRKLSYPEKFFAKCIKNNFKDNYYKNDFNFYSYFLDFAWPHLRKCIEIDGDQHYQFKERIDSDTRKDELLLNSGWKVLRIRWKDMFDEPKKWIQIAKDFIEEDIEHLEDNLENYRKELEEKERIKNQKKIDQCHETALKINALIDAKIDYSKRGCIQKASEIIGISPQKTRNWIEKNYSTILN